MSASETKSKEKGEEYKKQSLYCSVQVYLPSLWKSEISIS